MAIANPENLPPGFGEIDVAGEVTALADLLAELRGRVIGTVLPGRSGLPAPLRKRLEQEGWEIVEDVTSWGNIQRQLHDQHVLHILAHGLFKQGDDHAYLLLEDEGTVDAARGSVHRVVDQEIVDGLAGVHPLPQLVFLAACDSAKRPENGANPFVGLAPKLVEKGVPAVVAMQDLVPMDLAHTLTGDFYRRLFAHGQVDRALNEARSLLYKGDKFEWAIPVLFLRLRDGRLFAEPEKAPARRRLQAPSPPAYFAGRVDEIKRLGDRLTAQPETAVVVAIQGVGGQGKSAAGRQIWPADLEPHFPGGVLWVDVGQNADTASRARRHREPHRAGAGVGPQG